MLHSKIFNALANLYIDFFFTTKKSKVIKYYKSYGPPFCSLSFLWNYMVFVHTSHKACFMICKSVIALITWLSPSKVTIDIFHRYYRRFVDESSIHFITNLNDTMVRRPPQAWQVSIHTWVCANIHYFQTTTILTRCFQKTLQFPQKNLMML